jgi:hypothetical protein
MYFPVETMTTRCEQRRVTRAGTILTLCAGLYAAAAAPRVHAQEFYGNPCRGASTVVDMAGDAAAYARLRQLDNAAPLSALTIRRPSIERTNACQAIQPAAMRDGWAFGISPLPVRVRTLYNSAYPLNVNTGALWAGRGVSGSVAAGFDLDIGFIRASLYPSASYQQNLDFPMRAHGFPNRSEFAYAGHRNIDWPQRHGDEPFWRLDPGQSVVRAEGRGVTAGFSTENMWLGPAQRMSLLMGSSAPGFPHGFVATATPLRVPGGRFEAQAFWGRLTESPYFDGDATNDHRLIAGLSLSFEPAFARGLFIGANRMYLAAWDAGDLRGMLIDPYVDIRENPRGDNQLFSLHARWVHPAAGFEVYGEWAREDHWGPWSDLLLEPDHSQAYMLGFQKVGRLGTARLRWFGELAHLQSAMPVRAGRGAITFYTHSELTHGFTHRGQLLGAWIGPGSDAQVLGVERSTATRMTGVMIERVRFDDDAYYNQWARFYAQNGHDVSLGASLYHAEQYRTFLLRAGLGTATRHNRNFIRFDGSHPGDFRTETNVHLDLELRWSPGR